MRAHLVLLPWEQANCPQVHMVWTLCSYFSCLTIACTSILSTIISNFPLPNLKLIAREHKWILDPRQQNSMDRLMKTFLIFPSRFLGPGPWLNLATHFDYVNSSSCAIYLPKLEMLNSRVNQFEKMSLPPDQESRFWWVELKSRRILL